MGSDASVCSHSVYSVNLYTFTANSGLNLMTYRAVDRHNMIGGRGFRGEELKFRTFVFQFLDPVLTSDWSGTAATSWTGWTPGPPTAPAPGPGRTGYHSEISSTDSDCRMFSVL